MKKLLILSFLAFYYVTKGQTTIYGTVKDDKGNALNYATVYFKDKKNLAYTDADGKFTLSCKECMSDSVFARFNGYTTVGTTYIKNTDQKIDFNLPAKVLVMDVVELFDLENPAFSIMRAVIDNKDKNDIRSLKSYQYESYNKIELDIKNLSEDFMEKKIIQKLNTDLQSLEKLVDKEGRQFFPVFISETLSDYYFRTFPEANKEIIKATRSTGVGMSDGSFTSQLVGATFTQFNFYKNSIRVLEKEFISPIASTWKIFYDYELLDSIKINGRESYEMLITPKNPNALAFVGKIWIDKETYALAKLDLKISSSANLNFINSIDVTREYIPSEASAWFPRRTDITIDAINVNDKWASPLIRSTFTVDKLIVNQEKENKFYEYPMEVKEDAQLYDQSFWESNRHDSLSTHEKAAFALVDTIKNLPSVRSYIDIFNIVVNGYKDLGKIAIGPYISTYAYNNIENHRFRLGFKTNIKFSRKMFHEGYLAYGTKDKEFKYNFESKFILSRAPYIKAGFQFRKDIDQLGISVLTSNNIFDSFIRWGQLIDAYYNHTGKVYVYKQLNKHFTGQIDFQRQQIRPIFNLEFLRNNNIRSTINVAELGVMLKFSYNEGWIQTDFGRQSLGSPKPEFWIDYKMGFDKFFGGEWEYQKMVLNMKHVIPAGFVGKGVFVGSVGKIFGTLPYPLLNVHLGNQTPFYVLNGFNMMRYTEFVSDQFIDIKYVHHFNGLFFDRIPLFKRLKWREVGNFTALWGNVSDKNREILEPGSRVFGTFSNYPYMEIGYGVENIFKVLRIELFQRLTYLNRPNVNRFGLKLSVQFAL